MNSLSRAWFSQTLCFSSKLYFLWCRLFLYFFFFFQGTDVFLGFWPFGNALCKAVVSIDYYNMFTSTFTLTVMSMDRYVAVCHPVKALDMRTPHKAKVKMSCFKVRYLAFWNLHTCVLPGATTHIVLDVNKVASVLVSSLVRKVLQMIYKNAITVVWWSFSYQDVSKTKCYIVIYLYY